MHPLDLFKASGFVSLIVNGLLAIVVYKNSKRSKLNIRFAVFSLCIGCWSVGSAYVNIFSDHDQALLALRQAYAFGVFVPPLFLHFITTLVGWDKHKTSKFLQRGSYLFSSLLALFVLTPLFIKDYRVVEGFNNYRIDVPGPIYYLFAVYFVLSIPGTLALLIYFFKKHASDKKKKQLRLVFLGYFFGCIAGMEYFSGVFGFLKRPPIDDYLLVATFLSMAIAILKYHAFDIYLIVKRTLVFAGLLAFVFGVYTTLTIFVRGFLGDYFFISEFWSNTLAIGLIVAGYDPLRQFLINLTDNYLFQKQYDYHKVLKDASRGMAKIESLKHLLGLVLHFITMKMRVENAAVLSLDNKDHLYRMIASRGYKIKPRVSLNSDHPIVQMLNSTHDAIRYEEIKEKVDSDEGSEPVFDYKIISDEMRMLEAQCAIPSFLGKELRNILLIGGKKSGDIYSSDDLNLLMTLAQESAIAFENARLYDEVIDRTRLLEHTNKNLTDANEKLKVTQASLIVAEKNATMVGMSKAIGHEVNNPLSTVAGRASWIYGDNLSQGRKILSRVAPVLPEEDARGLEKVFSKIEDNAHRIEKSAKRIDVVVKTLTDILKDTKGEISPLSLVVLIREAREATRFVTYEENLSGCQITEDIAATLLIMGNLEQLLQVFVNLIKNAYEAMLGQANRHIEIRANVDAENPKMAKIEFIDNGPGIPPEVLPKIWGQGFSTKTIKSDDIGAAGQGQGLFICKHMIESVHRGSISVESVVGRGTTFTIKLPLADMEG